jgi:hypothetical protein
MFINVPALALDGGKLHRQPAAQTAGDGAIESWQEWQGSNLQPPVLETGALPIELHS